MVLYRRPGTASLRMDCAVAASRRCSTRRFGKGGPGIAGAPAIFSRRSGIGDQLGDAAAGQDCPASHCQSTKAVRPYRSGLALSIELRSYRPPSLRNKCRSRFFQKLFRRLRDWSAARHCQGAWRMRLFQQYPGRHLVSDQNAGCDRDHGRPENVDLFAAAGYEDPLRDPFQPFERHGD